MSGAQGEGAENSIPNAIPNAIPTVIPAALPESCNPPKVPEHLDSILSDIHLADAEGGKICSYSNQVFCTVRQGPRPQSIIM